jgi:hypothetical protein
MRRQNLRVWLATYVGMWAVFIAIAAVFGGGWPTWAAYVAGALNATAAWIIPERISALPRFIRPEQES